MKLASAVTGLGLAGLMAYGAFGADPTPPAASPPQPPMVELRLTPPEANLMFQALQQAPLQWKDSNPLILKLEQAYREATAPKPQAKAEAPKAASPFASAFGPAKAKP